MDHFVVRPSISHHMQHLYRIQGILASRTHFSDCPCSSYMSVLESLRFLGFLSQFQFSASFSDSYCVQHLLASSSIFQSLASLGSKRHLIHDINCNEFIINFNHLIQFISKILARLFIHFLIAIISCFFSFSPFLFS